MQWEALGLPLMEKTQDNGSNHQTLNELVPPAGIQLNLPSNGKVQVIEHLLELLDKSGMLIDRQEALDDLLARERQGSTALGRGVALPHAKTAGASQPVVAFGRVEMGLDFEALDGMPVYLVFLLVVPRERAGMHLKVVSALNRFLRNEDNRRRLREAREEGVVRDLLREIPIR